MADEMLERRTLGRTGLEVTAIGFGAGGFSRAGLGDGVDHAAGVVAQAIDSGINLIDTAEMYRTEPAVAAGIARSSKTRDEVVIATKVGYRERGADRLRTPEELEAALRARLDALESDYLDVVQLHGLTPEDYEQVRDDLLPVLERARDAGTVRWIGVTEAFRSDRGHAMLARAIADGCWDVVMVGFNLLNQSARERVLAPAIAANIGVMDMFAVRQALRDLEVVSPHLREEAAAGVLPSDLDVEGTLALLARHIGGAVPTLPDLAYRFVRAEPGVSTVLVGTGNPEHLRDNLASFTRPALDAAVLEELRLVFDGVEALNGETGARARR
ncbi:MAG: aldo/keto reductase [Chloroflexi bacterium]|nr:aldo/keto reductase [Chloroflexota bacterium]MDA1147540.1 aldo/keto reductase [Chloroflexota bacterium]